MHSVQFLITQLMNISAIFRKPTSVSGLLSLFLTVHGIITHLKLTVPARSLIGCNSKHADFLF